MCGIAGIIAFSEEGKIVLPRINAATKCLAQRGPDDEGIYLKDFIALGHRRLSVIDTSTAAAQPMTEGTGRYTIIFNGEIFNYTELRKELEEEGVILHSQSDTEVLLQLYIQQGAKCLSKLNGFFAFTIYDATEETLFIARDRMGVKPLLIYSDNDKLLFASEMKAMLSFGIPKVIDTVSLANYLQLNYIPAPHSIFKDVTKLMPGNYLYIYRKKKQIEEHTYYTPGDKEITNNEAINASDYKNLQSKLVNLLDESVQRRMIADVPLGAFLSGGIDSSVIVALASQHTRHLNTFSIGYKDEPLFDETKYADLVAKKYQTDHTAFMLTNDDLYENLYSVLDYIDEPFADSSALAVYILSKQTRKHVTVALSGDGADELLGGYNKHRAEYFLRNNPVKAGLLKYGSGLLNGLPQSRNTTLGNKIRQANRFAQGAKLNAAERYWRWCGFTPEEDAFTMLKTPIDSTEYQGRKAKILKHISPNKGINDVLYTDAQLVLQNDMLTKVDMMSMANGLEVRNPFLDYKVVDFSLNLSSQAKIDPYQQKKILRDAFRNTLPGELFNRPKKGFEVPLLKWMRTELKSLILNDLLQKDFIIAQNIFEPQAIEALKKQLFSRNPGEIHAQIWGLIVFQYWYKKYFI